MAKKKVVEEVITEAVAEIPNILSQDTAGKIHTIARLAHDVLPANRQVVIVDSLVSIIHNAVAAYRSHTGQPYDPASLPEELLLPLDSADDQ